MALYVGPVVCLGTAIIRPSSAGSSQRTIAVSAGQLGRDSNPIDCGNSAVDHSISRGDPQLATALLDAFVANDNVSAPEFAGSIAATTAAAVRTSSVLEAWISAP